LVHGEVGKARLVRARRIDSVHAPVYNA
jgi:hypothetical protein